MTPGAMLSTLAAGMTFGPSAPRRVPRAPDRLLPYIYDGPRVDPGPEVKGRRKSTRRERRARR